MTEKVSFNINAELYEDKFGDLAVKIPGEKVYRVEKQAAGSSFVAEATQAVEEGALPAGWREMPAHELLYGHGWHCISRMGYLDGDPDRPGIELEGEREALGEKARAYLGMPSDDSLG